MYQSAKDLFTILVIECSSKDHLGQETLTLV